MSEKKENVSVDEMMLNLKRGSDDKLKPHVDSTLDNENDRVLVTRADGSKAVKVRGRKRRSSQPKKEAEKKNTRKKIILICSGIFVALIFGMLFVVTLAYYNGNRFKEKLEASIQSVSGAELKMSGLNVSPGSATIKSLNLDWTSPNSVVDFLEVDNIEVNYGVFSFVSGGWNGPEVLAEQGELRLNLLDDPGVISASGEKSVEFDFNTYKCNTLNATFGEGGNWLLKDSQATYSINNEGVKQVYLYGGILKSPFFDDHSIKSGVVDIKQTSADLSLILQPEDGGGTVSVAGDVNYKNNSSISLVTKFADVKMSGWVDAKTQRYIQGDITKGEGLLKMKLGDSESKEILTHVESNKIGISTFTFIETLSLEMKDSFYSRPSFHNGSTFSMNWLKDKVVFSDIELVEDSHMTLKGNFEMLDSGEIKGKFKIGIPIVSLSRLEVKRLKKVFKEDDGELIWTEVTVGGTIASPTDDLADQFKNAKVKSPQDVFDQLNDDLSE